MPLVVDIILWLATGILAYKIGVRVERLRTEQKKIPAPINYIKNVLLPEPDDPRWEFLRDPWRMQLGSVWISLQKGRKINIGSLKEYLEFTDGDDVKAYAKAVVDSWCTHQSMDSIINTELQSKKDPQLLLHGV
jgi:hypothetical protein